MKFYPEVIILKNFYPSFLFFVFCKDEKCPLPYVCVFLPGKDVGMALCVEVPRQTGHVWTSCYQRPLRVSEMNGARK